MADTIGKINENIQYLESIHKKFNDSTEEGKWTLMERLYSSVNKSLAQWSSQLTKNTRTFEEHFVKTFKYSKKEYDSMLEVPAVDIARAGEGLRGRRVLQVLHGAGDQEGQAPRLRGLHQVGDQVRGDQALPRRRRQEQEHRQEPHAAQGTVPSASKPPP